MAHHRGTPLDRFENLLGSDGGQIHFVTGAANSVEGTGDLDFASNDLVCRLEANLVSFTRGELRFGIERANAPDEVAVELDSPRMKRRGREDVDQSTPDGQGAAIFDQWRLPVPRFVEAAYQIVPVHLLADFEREASFIECGAWDDQPPQRNCRDDERNRTSRAAQQRQDGKPRQHVSAIGSE